MGEWKPSPAQRRGPVGTARPSANGLVDPPTKSDRKARANFRCILEAAEHEWLQHEPDKIHLLVRGQLQDRWGNDCSGTLSYNPDDHKVRLHVRIAQDVRRRQEPLRHAIDRTNMTAHGGHVWWEEESNVVEIQSSTTCTPFPASSELDHREAIRSLFWDVRELINDEPLRHALLGSGATLLITRISQALFQDPSPTACSPPARKYA